MEIPSSRLIWPRIGQRYMESNKLSIFRISEGDARYQWLKTHGTFENLQSLAVDIPKDKWDETIDQWRKQDSPERPNTLLI